MSCTWVNWSYRSSGVPGVVTNGNPIESYHSALKTNANIDTDRVVTWRFIASSLPALLKWVSINCIGVAMRPDEMSCPIPLHTLRKARQILDSLSVNMHADVVEQEGAFAPSASFYFNTSTTWGRPIDVQRCVGWLII